MANPEFVGRILINSGNDSLVFDDGGSHPVTVTNGWRFLWGYTSEAATQIVEELDAAVKAVDANYSCVYSQTTGKVTFDFNSVTTSITFTDNDLGLILGFSTGSVAGGSTYTSDQSCRYIWQPSRDYSEVAGGATVANFWVPGYTATPMRASGGTVHAVPGSTLYSGWMSFKLLAESDIHTGVADLQQFFDDVVSLVQPVRVFPNKSNITSTDYVTAIIGAVDQQIGSFEEFRSRYLSSYGGLWDVDLPMIKYVA